MRYIIFALSCHWLEIVRGIFCNNPLGPHADVMFTARLSQPKLWLLFFPESQHIKVSNPCRSVNILLTPNLCFDSTSPCVVKKHHSLLCVCKAWFLSIRQAYLDFNHKGKSLWLPKSKNAISYFSIMHTSWYAQNLLWSILL